MQLGLKLLPKCHMSKLIKVALKPIKTSLIAWDMALKWYENICNIELYQRLPSGPDTGTTSS